MQDRPRLRTVAVQYVASSIRHHHEQNLSWQNCQYLNYIFSWKWLQKWWNVIGYFDRFDLILTKYEKRVVVEFTILWRLKQNMTRNMTKLLTVHPTKYFLQSSQKLMKSTNLNIYTPLASMKNHDNWRILGNSGNWLLFWLFFWQCSLITHFLNFPLKTLFRQFCWEIISKQQYSRKFKTLEKVEESCTNKLESMKKFCPVISSSFIHV